MRREQLSGKRFVLGGLAAAAALLSTAAFATSVDWPESYNNYGHTGANVRENTLSPANVGTLKLNWARSFAHEVRAMVLNDHNVIAEVPSDDGKRLQLWNINYLTGETTWMTDLGPNVPGAIGTLATGNVLVFSGCGLTDQKGYNYSGICAYRRHDGKLAWQFSNPCNCTPEANVTAPLLYAHNNVFFQYFMGGTEGKEYAIVLGAVDGTFYGGFPTGGSSALGKASPIQGLRLVNFDCGSSVCALRHQDGSLHWSTPMGAPIGALTTDTKAPVYANLCGGSVGLVALNYNTGKPLWTFGEPECNKAPVALSGKRVYFNGADTKVHALDAASGAELWATSAGAASSPSIANGVMYVSGAKNSPGVSAYDASSGALLWKNEQHSSKYQIPPVIIDGMLFAANQHCGAICSYKLPDGH